jgi:hypothetical protein
LYDCYRSSEILKEEDQGFVMGSGFELASLYSCAQTNLPYTLRTRQGSLGWSVFRPN